MFMARGSQRIISRKRSIRKNPFRKISVIIERYRSRRRDMLDSALVEAAEKKNFKEIVKLIKRGANPRAKDEKGRCVLELISKKKTERKSNGAYAFDFFSYNPGFQTMAFLVEHGADLLSQSEYSSDDFLFFAAHEGKNKLARIAIDAGAEIDKAFGNQKTTPLMNAAYWGNKGVVLILLDSGADRSLRDFYGRSALDLAASGGNYKIEKILKNK